MGARATCDLLVAHATDTRSRHLLHSRVLCAFSKHRVVCDDRLTELDNIRWFDRISLLDRDFDGFLLLLATIPWLLDFRDSTHSASKPVLLVISLEDLSLERQELG